MVNGTPSIRARRQLFDWLSAAPGAKVTAPVLSPAEWQWVEDTARAYRLMPVLHWRTREHDALALPAELAGKCQQSFARQRIRWLAMQGGMVRTSAALVDAGIEHVFLKGAALCLATYAEPAVRPLRDLDILVAPANALLAREVLLELGFESFPGDANAALAHGYQLPAMADKQTRLIVELHHDLAAIENYDSRPLAEYALQTAQRVPLAGRLIPICAPDATFLHLALHAGAKSLFDCGPLVLADLSALIDAHGGLLDDIVDQAARFGMLPSLGMAVGLLARHDGVPDCMVPDRLPRVSAELLDHAEVLLVQPPSELRKRQMKRTVHVLGNRWAAFDAALKALKPSRAGIAAMSGTRSDSRWLWLHYPVWAWRRGWQFLSGAVDQSLDEETRKDIALAHFLVSGRPSDPA